MSRRNIAEEWKLEERGEADEQWLLQPAEQNAISQWQLQEEGNLPPGRGDWQPVDYVREPRQASGNWILPALVGVALVAVIAYVAWIALDRAGLFQPAAPIVEPTVEVAPPTAEAIAAPTEAPAVTPIPPTPSPEPTTPPTPEPSPTPIPLVELASVRVNTVGGVNARRENNLQAEVITILPEGDALYLVAVDQGDWIQIALPDTQRAWVSGEFVQRVSETVVLDEANRRLQAVGLPLLAAPAGPPSDTPAAAITETMPITGAVTPPLAPAVAISVTVNNAAGVNARETPDLGGTVVQLLARESSYTALARTPDGAWVQIRLPDGRFAWAATQFLTANGDVNSLSTEPVTPGAVAPAGVAAVVTTTTPITTAATVTTTTATTPTVTQVVDGVTASVINLSGANARSIPDRNAESIQLLAFDSVLPVVGRSADGEWLQVTLAEGRIAWILANAVSLNADIASLPVVNP